MYTGLNCGERNEAMALPTVHLTEIPEEGLSVAWEVQPDEIALGVADAKVQDAFSVSAEVHKTGKVVTAEGTIEGTFVRQCVRCLKEYDTFETVPFTVEYRRQEPGRTAGRAAEQDNADSHGEEVYEPGYDVYDYSGDQVELAAMLREQVILATPMQPLCDADCLGLCPVCGQDRNERSCGCPEPLEESPFSALKQLRDSLRGAGRSKSDPQRN
jgi:DUF177 domain-containing protein